MIQEASFAPLEAEAGLNVPTIHVISDSLGDTAADVALAATAQFESAAIHIERLPKVTSIAQVSRYLDIHSSSDKKAPMAVFHTIVQKTLRDEIINELEKRGIYQVDLLGPALKTIEKITGQAPIERAGVIHRTDERYFRRIDAMEFFVNHDDGRNPQDLTEAEIVLIGVSRTSKTPLSMYMAYHGYRIANIPLAKGVEPPQELFDVDPWRIYGLISTAEVLQTIRKVRLGSEEVRAVAGSYCDLLCIQDELDEARKLMRRLGCIVIQTNGRAVEETAQIILDYFSRAETLYLQKET
ncbi:MAG: kinase/pyrophosphorylase [Coriobacteriales bacterium]|nr:kinase/pyrophosphorylase [Coriobacteriales bacterium]